MKTIFALPFVAVLAGCNLFADAELYLSDVQNVALNGATMTSLMTVNVEAISAEGCAEIASELAKTLERYYASASFQGCVKNDYKVFAKYKVTATMSSEALEKEPVHILAYTTPKDNVAMSFQVNPAMIEEIKGTLPDRVKMFLTDDVDLALSARINNDLGEQIKLSFAGVYANGVPINAVSGGSIDLDHRADFAVALSNVTNDALMAQGGFGVIAWFPKGQ